MTHQTRISVATGLGTPATWIDTGQPPERTVTDSECTAAAGVRSARFMTIASLRPLRCALLCLGIALPCSALAQESGVAVTTLLESGASWDGTPLHYPQGGADITNVVVEIAPGAQTGWHRHPVPAMAYVLEGELELQLKDGRTQRVHAGESVVETVDTWHNGVNVGTVPVKLVAFYLGVDGQPLTEMEPAAP